ncbi:MAG: hypothetical protein KGR26_09595 [Cyanobacteria bacterium REEB65]|nr:hypothetical protein [Cyanobacteria bacterium REEB65]
MSRPQTALAVLPRLTALALAFLVALFSLLRWERVRNVEDGLLSVPPQRVVKIAACGYDNVLADAFYLRFSTYWGYWLTHGRKFHNLFPLLDIITSLDPDLHPAYEVGALALADADQVGKAVDLLNKGSAQHPEDYWYPYQAGLMIFLYSNDYLRAAHYFDVSSHKPGAPPDPAYFEARMYNVAHRRTDALDQWVRIYLSGDKDMAEVASHSLRKLYQIDARWIDLYEDRSDPVARRLAGRALLKAGVDLSVIDRAAEPS